MDTLRRNLEALSKQDPLLAARLHLPVASDHVRLPTPGQDAAPAYRHHRAWLPLHLGAGAVTGLIDGAPAGQPLLLFGLGLGEPLEAALGRADIQRIVAWERDPWLLRGCLSRIDVRRALTSGRLRLALGSDLLAWLPWAGATVVHPLAPRIYAWELALLSLPPGPRRALLATGELFVDDLAEALRARGYTVLPLELTRHARDELVHNARTSRATLVAAINYTQGLAELCAELALPLICWEIDPATDRPRANGPVPTARIFTYRQAHVTQYEAAGFSGVRYLPLATNPAHRQPPPTPPDPRHHAPISFVGSSMVAASMTHRKRFLASFTAWREDGTAAQAQDLLQRILQVQRLDPGQNLVPDQVEARAPGWRAWALARGQADPAMLAAEIAAAEKRLNVVASLGGFGIRAWGDDGWKLTARSGVVPMGRAGHGQEINAIYAASTINLDINRLYQPDIVTMRVFDVLACGGFVLAEHNEAITALLEPGREIETWRDQAELQAKVRHYLAHPDQARAIAEAGRDRVLAEHTITQRLDTMLAEAGLA